jgi:hypothetical protein
MPSVLIAIYRSEPVVRRQIPVLEQSVESRGQAEVLLGADNRHLRFRSSVRVVYECLNWFGRFYIAAIDRVHRAYISPTMLSMAVEHAQRCAHDLEGSTVLAF